jgi:hypothetical protein
MGLDVHHLENGGRGSGDGWSRAGVGVAGDGGGGGRVDIRYVASKSGLTSMAAGWARKMAQQWRVWWAW